MLDVDYVAIIIYIYIVNFNKHTTSLIKGIAIILMITTHVLGLFSYGSSYYTIGIPAGGGITVETIIGRAADICVYLFAFISGYGLFHSYQDKDVKSIFFSTLTKIIQFLLCYWLVIFILFLPFYAVNQGSNFQFVELIKTMFGHHGFFSYGWYVYFYLMLLITLPFARKILDINKWLSIAISYIPFIGTYIILNRFKADMPYYDITCVLLFAYSTSCLGYSFAKHNFLDLINNLFKGKRWLIILVTGVVGFSLQLIVFGYYGKGVIQPFSVVPIMIFLIELLSFNIPKCVTKSLDILGKNSMNMWYIHYIFFAPYITCYIHSDQWIIFSKVGIVAVILGAIISLIIALPFTYIDNKLIRKISFTHKQ